MSQVEQTLVLVKPDGVRRHLIGEVIRRYEAKGLTIAALEFVHVSEELAKRHYEEHKDQPFFGELISFITSGPVVAMILEGHNAIAAVRQINGATNPLKAEVGTIRGDFGTVLNENIVHASDSEVSAAREMNLWFPDFQ